VVLTVITDEPLTQPGVEKVWTETPTTLSDELPTSTEI
jgi:hypothetical protein